VVAPLQESDSSEADARDTATRPQPPQPPSAIARVTGGPGDGFPNTEDFYPAAARRLGESGAVIVSVCVNALGRLSKEPQVMQSSGSLKLDGGAVRLAKAGSGHYRATTENGQAVSSCFPMRVRFELR
jgi:TonB family protein